MTEPVSNDDIHDHFKFQKYGTELVAKMTLGTADLPRKVKSI